MSHTTSQSSPRRSWKRRKSSINPGGALRQRRALPIPRQGGAHERLGLGGGPGTATGSGAFASSFGAFASVGSAAAEASAPAPSREPSRRARRAPPRRGGRGLIRRGAAATASSLGGCVSILARAGRVQGCRESARPGGRRFSNADDPSGAACGRRARTRGRADRRDVAARSESRPRDVSNVRGRARRVPGDASGRGRKPRRRS